MEESLFKVTETSSHKFIECSDVCSVEQELDAFFDELKAIEQERYEFECLFFDNDYNFNTLMQIIKKNASGIDVCFNCDIVNGRRKKDLILEQLSNAMCGTPYQVKIE